MTALAADRNTPYKGTEVQEVPVKGGVKIHGGALLVLNAGFAAPGTTATGLIALGRAESGVDNTSGADGDVVVRVRKPTAKSFKWANSASTDEITQADVGSTCYIVDDQTVAKTDGTSTRSAAGTVVAVDSSGVWVE